MFLILSMQEASKLGWETFLCSNNIITQFTKTVKDWQSMFTPSYSYGNLLLATEEAHGILTLVL